MELTHDLLKKLLHYDPDTGIFTWKERGVEMFGHCKRPDAACWTFNNNFKGKTAGCEQNGGGQRGLKYITIGVLGKNRKAHRLAFLYMEGKLPKELVDHIDQDGTNNAWSNLRIATYELNVKNSHMRTDNKSGFNGVNIHKSGKWIVRCQLNGERIYGGLFDSLDDAIEKRKRMNIEYGFHENHGKKGGSDGSSSCP